MIPVITLDVHLSTAQPLLLGANPGSALRGALYETLRLLYDDGSAARSRDDENNPVAWLLRMEDATTSGGKDAPRPLALRPPLTDASTTTVFGLSLYGQGQRHLPLVLSAIFAMQRIGVGPERSQFILDRVEQVDPINQQRFPLLNAAGEQLGQLHPPPLWPAYIHFASALRTDLLTVQFLTPIRIIQEGRLCHRPDFRPWVQRLLERARLISEHYCEAPVWIPFRDLLADAAQVTIVQNRTVWVERWSGSRRRDTIRPTSGFVGTVQYEGEFGRLLPWLILGQALQVGKNTVKGCGWYQLLYEWR